MRHNKYITQGLLVVYSEIIIAATWENATFDYPEISKCCCCIVYNLRKYNTTSHYCCACTTSLHNKVRETRNLLTEPEVNCFEIKKNYNWVEFYITYMVLPNIYIYIYIVSVFSELNNDIKFKGIFPGSFIYISTSLRNFTEFIAFLCYTIKVTIKRCTIKVHI